MVSGEDRFGPFRAYLRGRAEVLEVRPHWSVNAYKDYTHPKREWEPRLADRIAAKAKNVAR